MRYSVTGATGLLGNNIVRNLLKNGHQVRVAVRKSSSLTPLQGLDVEIIKGKLGEVESTRRLVEGTDGLIHAAGLIWFGKTQQQLSHEINVAASLALGRQCARLGKRMVFVSSTDALAAGSKTQPANETCLEPAKCEAAYVVSKRQAESALLRLTESDALDLVIVNPSLFFGPWDWKPSSGKMILALTEKFLPMAPSGGISVGDARNIAAGILAAMQRGSSGQRYVLAGDNVSYLQLWRKIAGLVKRRGPITAMRTPMKKILSVGGDFYTRVTKSETEINSEALRLGACWNFYDSSKAVNELGYDPGNYETALRDSWNWLVENGYSLNKKKANA
ncbi:MAG: NAD-dependent epimerase/dehydratase family protein [Planctomycetaceae bacterium]|nr:NAD-dependent epimerase/dehydratase family protein [Planctomycetaceae bacterium]MCP4464405.1 NAD-dependent epimerase/dehydratase family protein [Planctomycetaceae bacterium]MDG1809571.1 NAD-dependent epimerase/dehydratase family protein [Pirellulaceae bacterium]MDG2104519.1 NAD-dependent epimerase/dehydratase family protein [Pirellulaceae bacterium]